MWGFFFGKKPLLINKIYWSL